MVRKTLYATEIAVILGLNKYRSISDIYLRLYEKYNGEKMKQLMTEGNLKKEATPEEVIRELNEKYGLQVNMKEDVKLDTTHSLRQSRQALEERIRSNEKINGEDQTRMLEAVKSVGNTSFGNTNEDRILEEYCRIHMKKYKARDQKFVVKCLSPFHLESTRLETQGLSDDNVEGDRWYLGGKIDAMLEDGTIIEVKNRAGGRLFKVLRNYEQAQVQAYLFIFECEKACLVEGLINTKGTTIHVIEETFRKEMWNDILKTLLTFGKVYDRTSSDDKFMEEFLKMSKENRDTTLFTLLSG